MAVHLRCTPTGWQPGPGWQPGRGALCRVEWRLHHGDEYAVQSPRPFLCFEPDGAALPRQLQ
eukprot:7687179-Lingulodinium_polyedra.AAC.1